MRIKSGARLKSLTLIEQTIEYHNKTKHSLDKYAQGPEFLDWDLQPNPYRYFSGVERIALPLDLHKIIVNYQSLYAKPHEEHAHAFPLNSENLGILLGLSMGLSAHKEYMGDRWSVRCNPSSGNLHPTEAYLITQGIEGLNDGIHHYLSEDHSLQQRMLAGVQETHGDSPLSLLALTSIHWREAWKYGERAFRYCQLDVGHAVAAIAYAARCLGWQLNILDQWSSDDIATLCGIDREREFEKAEHECPDLVLAINANHQQAISIPPDQLMPWLATAQWQGNANTLDKHPMYRWPVVEQVEQATRITAAIEQQTESTNHPDLLLEDTTKPAKQIIYGRRSAQHFDKQTGISAEDFYALLDKCLYRPDILPWSALTKVFPMFIIIYIHRVDALIPGLYLLANTEHNIDKIKHKLDGNFLWNTPEDCPQHLPLFLLLNHNMQKVSKTVSCHQGIASDGAFSMSMLFDFDNAISNHPMNYRKMHWQAGLIGQLLYLEAENLGLQGTGIGCFFDDTIHTLLGIKDMEYQVLYNFTVGAALNDTRIKTVAAYPHLDINL